MRLLFLLTGLIIGTAAFSQTTVTGKWKPVRFDMGGMMAADVKAGTVTLSDSLKAKFKSDEDPEASKKMMQSLGNIMVDKMKSVEEEYTATGEWKETNTETNKVKTGKYSFDPATNILTRETAVKAEKFTVEMKAGHMILTGDLESKNGHKGKMIVEYERL